MSMSKQAKPDVSCEPLPPALRGRVAWYFACARTTGDGYRVAHYFICRTKAEARTLAKTMDGVDAQATPSPFIGWILKGSDIRAITTEAWKHVSDPHRLLASDIC